MKYKTFEEVLEAESIFEAFNEFLKERNMTVEEFSVTEEGIAAQKKAEERFWKPLEEN